MKASRNESKSFLKVQFFFNFIQTESENFYTIFTFMCLYHVVISIELILKPLLDAVSHFFPSKPLRFLYAHLNKFQLSL